MNSEILKLARGLMLYNDAFANMPSDKLRSGITQFDFFVLNKFDTEFGSGGRLYLSDLKDKLGLGMDKVSKLARELEQKGLVKWTHDNKDTKGTYIELTDFGADKLKSGQEKTVTFYKNVISKFGRERSKELMRMMKEMTDIMAEELKGEDAG